MPGSALDEYSANYGDKLRAALGGPAVGSALSRNPQQPSPGGGGPYVPPQDPTQPMEPGGTNDPEGGQDMGGPMTGQAPQSELDGDPEQPGSAMGGEKGYTFKDAWNDAPAKAKAQQMTKLEQSLKQGNETIDSAYDELEKQLGTPPEKKKQLSREEKGMLLMQFGLSVLANNKRGLGAIGQAGGQALQSYDQMARQPARDYAATKGAIAGARAGSKVKLAEASALESVKQPAGIASKLPGKFTGDDGYVYFYDENGHAKKATDEAGKPIKAKPDADGNGGRGFESDAKYNKYMEIYGVDPRTGKPLEGLALQQAKQDALDFSNDRGKTLDDLDLDLQAEHSADSFMSANNDLFRDMTPEQVNTERNKIADERRRRLKRPVRSRLQPGPGSGEPTRGPSSGTKKSFATEADAQAAAARGEIQRGDVVRIGGRDAEVD